MLKFLKYIHPNVCVCVMHKLTSKSAMLCHMFVIITSPIEDGCRSNKKENCFEFSLHGGE